MRRLARQVRDNPSEAKLEPMILEPEGDMASVIRQANRVIGQWRDKHAPEGFGWTSLQVNVNSVADWHVDHRNMGPSCVMVLGDYVGGELEVRGCMPTPLHNAATMIDGESGTARCQYGKVTGCHSSRSSARRFQRLGKKTKLSW